MRKSAIIIFVLSISMFSGCSMSDLIFGVFRDGYTGGGYTTADKKDHYDRQVEASRNYSPWQE